MNMVSSASDIGKEQVFKVLDGEKTQSPPVMMHCFMAAAAERGITMREFREDPVKMAESFVEFSDKYRLDGVVVDMDTALEAHALGARVDFPEDEPARVEGPADASLDELIDSIDSRKLLEDERIQIYLEGMRLVKKWRPGLCVRGNADQGPFSIAMLLYGMENFMMDLLDEEVSGQILRLIDKCFDLHLDFHRLVMETGVDLSSFGDSSCGPDLISRNLYQKFAMPYHLKLRQRLEDMGIRTVCHICGRLDNILEDVASVRFAGVEIDYKTDISRARDVFLGNSTVFGIIDPSGVFYFGTPDQVEQKTLEVLELFGGRNLVIGAGCALPRGVPEENLRRFVNIVRRYETS